MCAPVGVSDTQICPYLVATMTTWNHHHGNNRSTNAFQP